MVTRSNPAFKTRPKRTNVPPASGRACAVFVKMWALRTDIQVSKAVALIDRLDEALLSRVEQDDWFPSPYGGAIRIAQAESAVAAAQSLIRDLTQAHIEVSIGVSWGHFERIYNVSEWNVTAPAINIAARMASALELKGHVVVDTKVKGDTMAASAKFKFGPESSCQVKRTSFKYHLVTGDSSREPNNLAPRPAGSRRKAETFGADIVVFDIERYSEQTQPQQTSLAERLSRIVEDRVSSLKLPPGHFGPAGDGGYLVFDSGKEDSASRAWLFAGALRDAAFQEKIPIRIGVSNGPVLKTRYRAATGGAVLRADDVSSKAASGGIAVTADFWTSLDERDKRGWKATHPEADNSIFLLEAGPLELAPTSVSNAKDLAVHAEKELTSLVYSTRRIVNRLYPPNQKIRKTFTRVQEDLTIFKNGDLHADRLFHIKTAGDKIFYWEITIRPEPEAQPVNFVSELDFQVRDESGKDYEIVYLISRNDPWAKHVVLFFLPAIEPAELEPRKIRLTYRWPKYWTLLKNGSELSSFSLRSPVEHLVRTYKMESGAGELLVKPEQNVPGARLTPYGPDASNFLGWTYEATNYTEDQLQFTLEVYGRMNATGGKDRV